MQRRKFLASLAASGLLPLTGPASAGQQSDLRYLSARADSARRYFVSGIDAWGRQLFDLPLPARAHAIAIHPSGETAVVIARRPGTFLQPIDLHHGRLLQPIYSTPDRHLYGHGVYSRDGRYLYTTENDFETGRGVIGVRDIESGYQLVEEFNSGGIGPHEICLMPNDDILVVANGGIRTHPDFERTPLNLESMQPSLVYIDRQSGQLIEQRELPQSSHQNSIRHLAVGSEGDVCLGMQYQGPKNETPPLIAMHRQGESLRLVSPPQSVLSEMRNYCGSVCADSSGQCFAVSSPRGNLITFWSNNGKYINHISVADGCGIAATNSPGEFLLSSGQGGLFLCSIASKELTSLSAGLGGIHLWDNHMATVT